MIENVEPTGTALPRFTVVTTSGCHFCHEALSTLDAWADEGKVEVGTVDATTPRGEALISVHRPALFPLVLLDGRFFSAGRLPRRKLEKTLALRRPST